MFGYFVKDPKTYREVTFDGVGRPEIIEEEPEQPKSSDEATGLYSYDGDAARIAKDMKPSARGELEITDLNRVCVEPDRLKVEIVGRGYSWLDTDSHASLLDAGQYVRIPEEIVWRLEFIDDSKLEEVVERLRKSGCGEHPFQLPREGGAFR